MTAISRPHADWRQSRRGAVPAETRRVLIVDDSRMQRRILSAQLGRWGYTIFEADSGTAALDFVRDHEVDIILSDWMMPGMDGVEFCRRFRAIERAKYVYFILLTSKTEKEEVAHGLDVGADDFLTKPVDSGELRARIAAGSRILTMARELTEKNALLSDAFEHLQKVHEGLDRDLREARKLQQSLVRERVQHFDGAEIACLFHPSGHVGGDLVGHFRVSETHHGFYAIDVSGHGVASALMTARLAGYLTGSNPKQNVALTRDGEGRFRMRPPDEVCAILNDLLLKEMETDLYFTMVLAEVDLSSGHVRLAQAGHPRPLIEPAVGEARFIGHGGLPIGLIPGASWEVVETQLRPGDRLFLYSDGLTEATDGAGQMLQEEGLAELLARHRSLSGMPLLEALMTELESLAAGRGFADDLSGVFLHYTG